MMCYICDYCCICLCDKNNLQRLSDTNTDDVNYYIKLTSLIPEMCFKEMNDQRLLCKECCNVIDIIYKFRDKCLKSKVILIDYITQLHSISNTSDKKNIIDQNNGKISEIFIKTESVDQVAEDNFNACFSNENNIDSGQVGVYSNNIGHNFIKKEEIELITKYDNAENFNFNFVNVMETRVKNEDEQLSTMECEKDENLFSNFVKSENNYDGSNIQKNYTGNTIVNSSTSAEPNLPNFKVLKVHMKTHADKITNKCTIPEDSKNIEENNTQKVNSSLLITYDCKICQKKYSKRNILYQHMRTHTLKNLYECKICTKKFSRPDILKQHLQSHPDSSSQFIEKKFECTMCEKKYFRSNHLVAHMRNHTGETPFHCTMCDEKFVRVNILKTHMLTHTQEKAFVCEVCNRAFSQKGYLAAHMLTHGGEPKYECEFCDKKFIKKNYLTVHRRVHTGERPYACDLCDKKFTQTSSLTEHKRIHSGEKPYSCDNCNKKFISAATRKRHSCKFKKINNI